MDQKKQRESSMTEEEENNLMYYSSFEDEEDGVLLVHSQVKKIKQEFEKIQHPALRQPEMRRVLGDLNRQRSRSPSPLGLSKRPISAS